MDKEKTPHSTTNSQRSSSTRDNPPSPPADAHKEHKKSEEHGSASQRHNSEPMQRLLGFEDRKSTFYKTLEEALAIDYSRIRNDIENDRVPEHLPKYPAKDGETPTAEEKTAYYCNLLKNECYEYIEPLHEGIGLSIASAIETHTAFAHLNKLHDLLDKICDMLDQNFKMQVYMQDLKTLTDLKNIEKKDLSEYEDLELSDPDSDLETNISLLSSILEAAKTTSTKRGVSKQRGRERSKSVFADASNQPSNKDPRSPPLRRQSAFTEGKAKVSKWTKVKAAFKWEKANVPALNECKSSDSGIGLLPINHEVARYLRVPSVPCGGSSADSILSSSSGHLLSEIGTPGTISSASSVDDIERASQSIRRDSSKSDSKYDSRITLEDENHRSHSIDGDLGSLYNRQELKDSSPIQIKYQRNLSESSEHKNSPTTSQGSLDRIVDAIKKPAKTSSLKGMRKSKIVSDFEALPEDVIVDITSKPKRTKNLPSPLNLNLKHDLSEVDYPEFSNSPNLMVRSPWEKTKNRKFQSPGNSSVPSSPSRHSEFFPEFESEDLSSGEFSEPTSPHNKLFSSNSLHMQQEEINQRYTALRERLKMEFEAKRQEWDKIRNMYSNTKTSAYHFLGKDDPPQQQAKSVSTKLLEENLTPDFKKKLHKWRVKKQISLHGHASPKELQASPTKESESKKIDWNLWRTGQIKLEGQGLSPLPDQKDLPEEFQKKLEQWNKIKTSGLAHSAHDILKRSAKLDPLKKFHDDEKHRSEKDKPRAHEREKLERLSKLKSIVADPRAKEIEVKTTAGVMKFEGISRKFTRKLYEWEKARGIGPESSTFALLHPGYCPLDVGKIPKECNKNESSPTLSRSLSLDSVAPCTALAIISHQTSSLSLNDVNDLNEAESTDAELRVDSDLKHINDERDEPEAVMVEVEDHIVETASPLVAVLPLAEHQTPVYRYAEVTCSDFCKSRSVQSFESHPSDGDNIKTLNYINDLWLQLESRNEFSEENLKHFQAVFSTMRNSFSEFEMNLSSAGAKRSFIKVKELVDDLYEINNLLQMEEACCQELIDERQMIFRKKLDDLHTTLNEVRQHIESEKSNSRSVVPEINVTSDDVLGDSFNVSTSLANTVVAIAAALSTTLEAPDDPSTAVTETAADSDIIKKAANRTYINGSGKKKLRLRKMGSRQNSKTESDSSDGECANILETPRRVKRKASSRIKQRSFEEDRKSAEESRPADEAIAGEDIVYVLKMKPGQPIEQQEISQDKGSKLLISPTESCVQLIHGPQPESASTVAKSNIFVKTKRKVFTTVEEAGTNDGLAVVATELDGMEINSKADRDSDNSEPISLKSSSNITKPAIAPGIKNMISKLCESMPLEKLASSPSQCNQRQAGASKALRNQHTHIFKSVSAGDIFEGVPVEIRKLPESSLFIKSLSFINLRQGWELHHSAHQSTHPIKTRIPLATDSFRALKKNSSSILPKSTNVVAEKREHLFRKNKNASPTTKTSGTGKRIETKMAKSANAADTSGCPLSPDKSDNTNPRITRKLEKKSLTPTSKSSTFDFEENLPTPSVSEPSTPMAEYVEKPRTPLSERAIRLQRAKEEFLQSGSMPKVTMRKEDSNSSAQRVKEKWENRHSNQSMCSDLSTGGGIDDGVLLKSISVGMLPADSDCSEQQSGDGYESLPRSVSRSGKLTSKLGFSTLASKLRRVKLRKGSKDAGQPTKGSALTALCRQSLFVDLNSLAQPNLTKTQASAAPQSLMKSQSSQAAIGVERTNSDSATAESEKLNKSKSENHFPHRKKESCV